MAVFNAGAVVEQSTDAAHPEDAPACFRKCHKTAEWGNWVYDSRLDALQALLLESELSQESAMSRLDAATIKANVVRRFFLDATT